MKLPAASKYFFSFIKSVGKTKMPKILVVTISDTCHETPSCDAAGPALKNEVHKIFPSAEIEVKILPDDRDQIVKVLLHACDVDIVSAIFTTGGTGFGPRDVTPEATKSVIEREAAGIATAMTVESLKYTKMASLSRAVAGIRGKTLIINFPGSPKAVKECFQAVAAALPHAISLISDDINNVKRTHDSNGESYAKISGENGSNCNNNNNFVQPQTHLCPHIKASKVDISKIALRDRNSPYPMVEVLHAFEIIEKEMIPMFKAHVVETHLLNSLGQASAHDVRADSPLPPFPASIKDGYACLCSDGAGVRSVRGAVCAGDTAAEPLQPGQCVRVNTGAPLPPNADCVVQVEDTKLVKSSSDGRIELEIEILKAPKLGEDVRPVGHDIRQGEVVVKSGAILDAGNIGILATVGVVDVHVYAAPVVGLLSTGNELQHPRDRVLRPGHIRDSNKLMLTALLREHGFESVDCGISRDDPDSMKGAISAALEKVDVLVTTGSVSMGERDMLKPIIAGDFNGTVHFGRTNMKPGKPTTFASCDRGGKKYIFGLPGNPVSAYVTTLLFVVPALKRCAGLSGKWLEMPATLATPVALDPRPEYARATLHIKAGSALPIVELTGNQCSSRLLSTCGAAVLVSLPGATASRARLEAGSAVTALLTTRPRPD